VRPREGLPLDAAPCAAPPSAETSSLGAALP
jgi:hypothetical protein